MPNLSPTKRGQQQETITSQILPSGLTVILPSVSSSWKAPAADDPDTKLSKPRNWKLLICFDDLHPEENSVQKVVSIGDQDIVCYSGADNWVAITASEFMKMTRNAPKNDVLFWKTIHPAFEIAQKSDLPFPDLGTIDSVSEFFHFEAYIIRGVIRDRRIFSIFREYAETIDERYILPYTYKVAQ